MSTFRVYLRRPTTKAPIWDWSQTVVAPNANTAIGYAYASWLHSQPATPLPPLSQCQTMANQAGVAANKMLLGSSAVTPAQQAFISNIQSQVSKMLATKLDGAFNVVSYPSGFNYGITYGNSAYYNQATLQDIDTLLGMDSNGNLDLTGAGFSNLYAQLMPAVTFSFSQQDQQTMNSQDSAASAQVASILTEFENAGGVYSNPLPFGGKLQDVFNQLTKQFGSLDNLPDTLNALRNAIGTYKAQAGDSYALHNRYYAATARIAAALANVVKPGASNGGMQVSSTGYYVGFTPDKLPTANQLIGSLNTASNAVQVQVTVNNFSSESSQLSIGASTGFSFPIADVLGISFSGSTSYDLSRYTSSASQVTMDLTYPGVTLFASIPSVLSSDNSTGWYANDILQEVVTKTGQDATGYKLQGSEFDVHDLFGPGKSFSRLKTFVISQMPTIKMTFSGSDTSQIVSDFKEQTATSISFLGLFTLGSASQSYSVHKVDTTSVAGSVVVTFGPPQVSGTIPLQQQVAYVLGGVASYPPNNI